MVKILTTTSIPMGHLEPLVKQRQLICLRLEDAWMPKSTWYISCVQNAKELLCFGFKTSN